MRSDPPDLRGLVLGLAPADVGLRPGIRRVWAALMETGYEKAVASLAVIGDGTVSLYLSNGGGIIGAGEHEAVRRAGFAFLDALEDAHDLTDPIEDLPLPAFGDVRFNVLTFAGKRSALAREQDLGEGRHPLSKVFYAGHDVIYEIQRATPNRG